MAVELAPPSPALASRRPPPGRALARRRRPASRPCVAARAATRTAELPDGVVVVAPAQSAPRGVVHFLGGAFVAAAPALTYPQLLRRLAEGGYTVVATPYAVTFRHVECAAAVHGAFEGALRALRAGAGARAGVGAWAAPPGAPSHGVGHSNGALLHLLAGATCLGGGGGRASNVLISYNNLRVSAAVPVPLGLLQPAVAQLRGGGRLAAAAAAGLDAAAAAAAPLLAAAQPLGPEARRGGALAALRQWDPALVQLGSVFDEVGDGYEDFVPIPEEARALIASGYAVPSTLLVQFTNDSTDESPAAEALLSAQAPAAPRRAVRRLVLPGTHVTPCGEALLRELPRGARLGPAEVLAAAAAAAAGRDAARLADRVLEHLDAHS